MPSVWKATTVKIAGDTMDLQFQSTPSVWKATTAFCKTSRLCRYFNPHLPCGRRLFGYSYSFCADLFQSTPSVWKATEMVTDDVHPAPISIHAFRVEGDLELGNQLAVAKKFQSTPSVWKATQT